MRNVSWLAGSSGLVVAVAVAHASGCVGVGDNCALIATCAEYADAGSGGRGGQDRDAPGADCPSPQMMLSGGPDASCGVFASSSAPPSGDGSRTMPYTKLQAAIDKAALEGRPVYACGQEFDESLHVPSGVTIYGGLDCAAGWVWKTGKPTLVKAPVTATASGATEIAMRLEAGAGKTVIEDVDVTAPGGTMPGVSSVAVLIADTRAELTRSHLTAGDGMKGEDGAHLGDDPALSGVAGTTGFNICGAVATNPGPDGPTKTCGAQVSTGGGGGDGGVLTGLNPNGGGGKPGTPPYMSSPTAGIGGAGQSNTNCAPGAQGADGDVGDSGLGAAGKGDLSTSGYGGLSGQDGSDGKPGQGGGGGGASKGKSQVVCPGSNNADRAGATGGSGGTGGCGGAKGGGGKAGGSSMALLSLAMHSITLTSVVLDVGNGGNGGSGGDGQNGGSNGSGANGGQGASGAKAGCTGGNGGLGGAGGPGGGGSGGHAIGVAYNGTAPKGTPSVSFKTTPPTVGIGGAAAANSADPIAGKGADGTTGALVKF